MTAEQWLPIPGWEGYYEVSDHGRVRSLDRTVGHISGFTRRARGRVLKHLRHNVGYQAVGLHRDGTEARAFVHRLVLEAFVGPPPVGTECLHVDGDPANNHLGNLRWGSHAENMRDILRHGRCRNANKTTCKHGHPFDAENTYWHPQGFRQCRACDRARRNRKKVPA